MTSKEIVVQAEYNKPEGFWLREIAYQLARLNERQEEHNIGSEWQYDAVEEAIKRTLQREETYKRMLQQTVGAEKTLPYVDTIL